MSMKTARIIILAATTSILGASGLVATASAQTPPPPQQTAPMAPGQLAPRISVSQLATKLEQAGYVIHDIEHKRYGWEVDVIDKNQQRLELKVDMQGNITRQEYHD